jgi:hypothetical protein
MELYMIAELMADTARDVDPDAINDQFGGLDPAELNEIRDLMRDAKITIEFPRTEPPPRKFVY